MTITKTQTTNFKTRLYVLYLGAFLGALAGAGGAHQYNLTSAIPTIAAPTYQEHLSWRVKRLVGFQQFLIFARRPTALAGEARHRNLPPPLLELVSPAADRVLLWGPAIGALVGAALAAALGLLLSERKSHA